MLQILSRTRQSIQVNNIHWVSQSDQQPHIDNKIRVLDGKMQKDLKPKINVREKVYQKRRQSHIQDIKEKIKLDLFIQQYLKATISDVGCVLGISYLSNVLKHQNLQLMDDNLIEQILLRCKKSIASQLSLKILNIICYFSKRALQKVQNMQIVNHLITNILRNARKYNYGYVCMGVQILYKLQPRIHTVRWDGQITDVLLDMIGLGINTHTKVRLLRMLIIAIQRNYVTQECQMSTNISAERIIKSILICQQLPFDKKILLKSYFQYLCCLVNKFSIKETNQWSYRQIVAILVRFAEWLDQIMYFNLIQNFDDMNNIKNRVFYWIQYIINHQILRFDQLNYDDVRLIGKLVVNSIKFKSYNNFSICKQIYLKIIRQARMSSQQRVQNIQSIVTNISELLESSQLNMLSMVLEFFDIIIYNCLKNGNLDEKNILSCKFNNIYAFSNIQQIKRLKGLLKGFKQLQYKFNRILRQISSISHFQFLDY